MDPSKLGKPQGQGPTTGAVSEDCGRERVMMRRVCVSHDERHIEVVDPGFTTLSLLDAKGQLLITHA